MAAKGNWLNRLQSEVLLGDGAMGTQLFACGLAPGESAERWNVQRSAAVQQVHRRYYDAGCQLITTNSFGGSAAALAKHGLAQDIRPINEAAVRIARRGTGPDAIILGDIGPFGGFLEPVGDMNPDTLAAMFTEQAQALADGGADGIIIETMVDPAELALAVRAAKSAASWPVVATFTFNRDGSGFRTIYGTTANEAVAAAIDCGADVVGGNCGTDLSLDDYARLAETLLAAAGRTPVILQPNAGAPQNAAGGVVYPGTPAQMAHLAVRLAELGVKIVGGCCGTTPEHLLAMAQALRIPGRQT